jgi:hypothetical protein
MAVWLAALSGAVLLAPAAGAAGQTHARIAAGRAHAQGATGRALAQAASRQASVARAPSGPPLVGQSGLEVGAAIDESSASAPPSTGDPLVQNGLGSPLCGSPGQLPRMAQGNCRNSGFVAAPEPTGDFAFDVNIDTGVGMLSNNGSAIVQDFAQEAWMALVAVTHGLIVMFEWCYSLHLLGRSVMSQVTQILRATGLQLFEPWLALALSIAAVLAAYRGLVVRQVAETLGQVFTTIAMMAAALWLIASPATAVGTLERWADSGASATLAAMSGSPAEHSRAALATSMTELFGAAVVAPWCYLEFGNVGWCEDSRRLDPRLRRAALATAARLRSHAHCDARCATRARPSPEAIAAGLLGAARTNGQLFLALPANEPERNSVKAQGTLLNVLCGGGEAADKCHGPTAAEAQFRSERGTSGRLVGLACIWLGALGMLLLFGLLAARLLLAAVVTLLYLLLAPVALLAPALSEAGRSAFRVWMMRLLAACVSKLTYSFLLGALLGITHILLSLSALGWWAQWSLLSACWWTAFAKRNHVLGLLSGGRGMDHARRAGAPHWRVGRRVERSLLAGRASGRVFARSVQRPGQSAVGSGL